ncbi:MAG: LL-diaminopimelate aminotransferase [Muribaculum sp.]|nr:LL-diaminopimelate aminotransferase [Muribaculaceae bacterium]MCM1081574.1 LL-diaminopimelate aminotransferase [Muribaculum sp.]
MILINQNFTKLPKTYLFTEVGRRVAAYRTAHPGAKVISLGIGDVTLPLSRMVTEAMKRAADDLAASETFHGYGPEQGYPFLREKIALFDYVKRGVELSADEIFVSDGAKSDTGNIVDLLDHQATIAVTDPVYPVYVDTNVIAGHAGTQLPDGRWSRIEYMPCTAENDFVPALPAKVPTAIYLCFPNNPTGTSLTRDQLSKWVDYARENSCLIMFDSAYEAYIQRPDVPHSIYEIEGAKEVAIEFRSFSKTAGFTGVRCGYTVVPKQLKGVAADGTEVALRDLWLRRQCTKFNGASYVAQRAAEALYTPEGQKETEAQIGYYMQNARLILEGLSRLGLTCYGGIDSPYIWVKTPQGISSWEFFDMLLEKCQLVCTPGSGFGAAGEGYVRLTAFGSRENTIQALARMNDRLGRLNK